VISLIADVFENVSVGRLAFKPPKEAELFAAG